MTEKTEKPESSRDGLALVVGGLFILALVFAAYNYFSHGAKLDTNKIDDENVEFVEDIENGENPTEQGDLNGEGAKTENGSLGETAKPGTISGLTTQTITAPSYMDSLNDYKKGDIKAGSYSVKSGDTLWEIAEGLYGDGSAWTKILDANKGSIGFLASGEQALIVPGQVLVLP